MSYKYEIEEGKEVDVFTQEEVEARAKEEADKVAATKDAEIEHWKKVGAEKTENFKKYNEMTTEEKAAYDANTTNLLRRGDALEEELGSVKKTLAEKEQAEKDYLKNSTLKKIHADVPDVKEKVEKEYAILAGMPETTPEEVTARALAAAKLAGVTIDQRNPLYISIAGEAPNHKQSEQYTETPEGKEAARLAREAMGLPEPKQ